MDSSLYTDDATGNHCCRRSADILTNSWVKKLKRFTVPDAPIVKRVERIEIKRMTLSDHLVDMKRDDFF